METRKNGANTPGAKGSAMPKSRPVNKAPTVKRTADSGANSKPQNKNQTAKKRTLTPEQVEQIMREKNERKRALRRSKLEYVLSLTIVFLVAFCIMGSLFASVFFINLKAHKKPDTSNYRMVLSDYDNTDETALGSVVGEDGLRYFNFSQMADFFGFAMVGSIENMKYIVKGSENETVAFYPGRDLAFVNDVFVRTDGECFEQGGDLYVNESFIEENVLGLKIEKNSDKKTVNVSRILLNSVDNEGKISDGKAPMYEEITFALKAPAVTEAIAEDDSAVSVPAFSFVSELSAYEEYMNPGSTIEFLTLVNADNPLKENYIPTGLTKLSFGEGMLLKEYAANAFEAMMLEARACGIVGLTVTEAYVSYSDTLAVYNEVVERYEDLFNNNKEQAKRYAAATVASPGTDEHQTGLAVNLGLTSGAALETSTAYSWLLDNAEKFGFIVRYPIGTSDITDGASDPAQFRYVGRYHAVRINDLGMTLDEYCEYLGV